MHAKKENDNQPDLYAVCPLAIISFIMWSLPLVENVFKKKCIQVNLVSLQICYYFKQCDSVIS